MNKISIITTTYNSDRTIRDTMLSVLKQDYEEYEHIIIDGGSIDETLDIIKELSPLYKGKLRWISEADKGIYDAMNKGINLASGDIIGILNSDDFFTSSDILSTVNEEIEGVDAIYGDIHYVNPADLKKIVRYYSSEKFKPKSLKYGLMPAHPSFYCRRKIYERLGKFDIEFKTAADFEILLRFIYLENITTKYVKRDFVTMRTGGETSSGLRSYKKSYVDKRKALKKHGLKFNYILATFIYLSKLFELLGRKFINKNYQ